MVKMSKNSLSLVLLFHQKTSSHIELTHVSCSFGYRAHAEFGGLVGSIHLFKCQLSFGAISIAFHQSHQRVQEISLRHALGFSHVKNASSSELGTDHISDSILK